MTDRRSFIKRAGSLAGAAAFGDLFARRAAVAGQIQTVTPLARRSGHLAQLREEYLLDPNVIYFNHASIGTIPRVVHQAQTGYLELCESNPWLYMWGGEWEEPRETVRAKAAALLHCNSQEIAFTHNTTEGFNVIAQGLPLGPDDEVVFSSMNHPGASVCWYYHAEAKGFQVRRFDFPIGAMPQLTTEDILDIYGSHLSSNTRVLVFPHIDNIVGLRYPVRELADLAHSRGVEFVAVDGAQSLGMIPIDLAALNVDFYAASPHKWLQAPKGLGLLYVRDEVREMLRPMWVTWGQERWAGTARVFEDYGTRNLAELITLGDAIDFQQQLGEQAKEARYQETWQRAREIVEGSSNLIWHSPTTWDRAASLFAVEARGVDTNTLSQALYREHGIVFRAFRSESLNHARLSPNTFNTEEELERVLSAMAKAAGD
jgi:selenocysteine lyase/cysteine desulfurase